MDRPLESGRDRDHPYGGGGGGRRDNHYGGGGGGGYNNNRRGRGRGRGGFRGRGRGRGRGGRGGHHHHHRNNQHHRNNNNRDNNREWQDPNAVLITQLSVMVSRVGEYKVADDPPVNTANLRPVVAVCAQNISSLSTVVSKPTSIATFLKFIPPPPPKKATENATGFGFTRSPPKPEDQAGPMAHLIVSCAATLPLQTPSYAALTMAVNAYSKSHEDYAGFAGRCVTYTLQRLSCDMDLLLLQKAEERSKIACRIKLLLRYLALLGKLEVIQVRDNSDQEETNNEEENEDDDPEIAKKSLLGFLQQFVEAAVAAAPTEDAFAPTTSFNAAAPLVLVYFILSTIPYLASYVPVDVIQELLLDPLQPLLGPYSSSFSPGVGMTAILLKEEQAEGDEEEEDDDDEEEEEEQASEVVCDSLQDLNRSVQLLLKQIANDDNTAKARFALLTDEPWKGVSGPPKAASDTAMDTAAPTTEGNGQDQPIKQEEEQQEQDTPAPEPLVNPDPPIRLILPKGGFQSLAVMTNPQQPNELEEDANNSSAPKIQSFPLEVVVFGRLPIFGAPKGNDDETNNNDDDDDMEDDDAPANEQVAAYSKEFGILDRCFLADAIRDLLCCLESAVSATGLERGSVKAVAEQLWSLGHVFGGGTTTNTAASPPTGLEYGILEVMLSLIVQSSSNSTFRQVYLSRVLLELTRLQPLLVSPALALAVSNLFQDYTPSLVPAARYNLGCWLAFHLVNTDYQWPAAYWTHWQAHVGDGKNLNSRGVVVKTTLHFLMENVHNPSNLVKDCLPKECTGLVSQIVCPFQADEMEDGSVIDNTEKDIRRRVWDDDEHPDTLLNYLIGEELSEAIAGDVLDANSSPKRMWCRSGLLLRALLQPLEREHRRLLGTIEQAQKSMVKTEGEEKAAMEEDEELSDDTLTVIEEVLVRHGRTLTGAIQKDKEILEKVLEGTEKDGNHLTTCEPYLLSILATKGAFSRTVVEACLANLLQQSVLSSLGVLRWALGELVAREGSEQPLVTERWWDFAVDAIRNELTKKLAESNDAGGGGMVIDRTGENTAEAESGAPQDGNVPGSKTLAAIESTGPLLDYIVRRACTLLSEQTDDQQHGNKLKPLQVDLVEGVKACVRATHGLFMSELKKLKDNGPSERDIKDCLQESSVAGTKLAGVCSEFSGSNALILLRDSLTSV
ncbi:expressed unknown protein [Seminavis robusta]|uniref:Uncharacterized protein n=1 Tax=Seminavis robusta TaxID=568900 RepID=A0A9N8HD82_9STRA|nr:expressed unknown protein [Seminavis robusta]|eukprot:Sro332_g119400.1 n/a (1183) ;mRNA; f:58209-61757